ncbi:OmpA/MotB [alpha proteobacterium BAL199]|jgi:chemotaxis protein MotB|nr:OmpA/MotB [alpha proteobacterium BAL199]
MSTLARRRQRDTNIWPGFVDALATLLMVIIFVLMIFVVAQFYLTRILSGKDESLARLTRQVAELSELLSLERETSAELRVTVAQLSSELQISITAREELTNQVTQLTAARDSLEGRLAELMASRAVLQQRLDESDAARRGIDARLLQVLQEHDALLGKLQAIEEDAGIAGAERAQSAAELEQAIRVIEANRQTIQLQLKDLERLRRDLTALREARQSLEDEISALVRARDALQAKAEASEEARKEAERKVVLLVGEIGEAETRIRTLTETNEATRARLAELAEALKKADSRVVRLETDLSEQRDVTKKLEARLAEQTERTRLAQSELEQRDIRLEELFSEQERTQQKLTEEQKISAESSRQVELLNAQIAALRQQLARIEAALEATETQNRDQKVQILDLGRRLNAALATKVQELARFRSEFFGRLREVLSDRDDVRIVGDRFVFQSEVLFGSGSAQIGEPGKVKLGQFAATLREIAPRIPKNIGWILQVEGHTDTVPIHNEQFRSNWELSAARAISVVKYLVDQGIPAERLSATGYGEYQPIDPADLERNRRIEMKLTQR